MYELELKKNWSMNGKSWLNKNIERKNNFQFFWIIHQESFSLDRYIYKAIFNDVHNYASNDYSKNNILIMYIIIRMMVWYYVRRIT